MKHILAIHANGKTRINPRHCPHTNTVTIHAGSRYTILGEAADDIESFEQCLDCDYVKQGDGSWGPLQPEFETTDQIPY